MIQFDIDILPRMILLNVDNGAIGVDITGLYESSCILYFASLFSTASTSLFG